MVGLLVVLCVPLLLSFLATPGLCCFLNTQPGECRYLVALFLMTGCIPVYIPVPDMGVG